MNLKSLFFPSAEPRIELTFTKSSFALGRSFDAGETASFAESDARQLLSAGVAYRSARPEEEDVELARLESLLPPPQTPRPLPECMEGLPKCFADYHNLYEQGACLARRSDLIEDGLNLRQVPLGLGLELRPLTNAILDDSTRRELESQLIRNSRPADSSDTRAREIHFLKDALARADGALKDWRTKNEHDLMRHKIRCSDHAQIAHGTTAREIGELHQLAFELFKTRVAALGLSERENRRLFAGSADAVRFASIPKPRLQNLTLAWSDGGSNPHHLLDIAPEEMARLFARWKDTSAEVSKLTAQARKELSAAQRVAKAA